MASAPDGQFRIYERLDTSMRESVGRGDVVPEPLPFEGGPRWGLSLVIIPPARISRKLSTTARGLALESANPHAPYAREAIHVTVSTLEPFRYEVPQNVIDHYAELVDACVRELNEGIALGFRGAGFAGPNIIARGYPNDSLALLRELLAQHAAASRWEHVRDGLAPHQRRDTAHATLLILKNGGQPDDHLVYAVEELQERGGADLGTFTTRELALVSYTVAEDSVTVHRHRTIRW